jgi:hypothetical protein
MCGSWWIFVDVTTNVTSIANLTRKPRSKIFECFRDINGRQAPENRQDTQIAKKRSRLQGNRVQCARFPASRERPEPGCLVSNTAQMIFQNHGKILVWSGLPAATARRKIA